MEAPIEHVISGPAWTPRDPALRGRRPQLFFAPAFPGVASVLLTAPAILPQGTVLLWE
jgi:hypothetical protein